MCLTKFNVPFHYPSLSSVLLFLESSFQKHLCQTATHSCLGDTEERSEKKRCALMPPKKKTQKGKPDVPPKAPAIPESTQAFPSRTAEDDGDSDSCCLEMPLYHQRTSKKFKRHMQPKLQLIFILVNGELLASRK